jgi:phosphoglycolate phosphatase
MKHIKDIVSGKTHIIWDWNGTLLDDVHICIDVIDGIASKHGGKKVTRESYLKDFRFPVVDYYKDLGFDLSRVSYEDLSVEFVSAYKANVHLTKIHVGMSELITELADSGVRSSILSAAFELDLQDMLRHFQIANLFDHIFGIQDHLAHGKIARGLDLMEKIDLPKNQVVLIGDTDHDADVAEALGIDVLLIEGGHQSKERLRQKGLRVISR